MYGEDEHGNSEYDAHSVQQLPGQGGSRAYGSGPTNNVFGTLVLALLQIARGVYPEGSGSDYPDLYGLVEDRHELRGFPTGAGRLVPNNEIRALSCVPGNSRDAHKGLDEFRAGEDTYSGHDAPLFQGLIVFLLDRQVWRISQ